MILDAGTIVKTEYSACISSDVLGIPVTSSPSFNHLNVNGLDPCNMPHAAVILWPIDADSGNANGWITGDSVK